MLCGSFIQKGVLSMELLNILWSRAIAEGTADAAASAAAGAEQPSGAASAVSMIVSLLPMVLIFVVFYFMLIRPQRKKDKQVKDMLANLKVGDRICTIGGIYGTIVALKDDTVTIAAGKNDTSITLARWGIRSVEEVSIENDAEALN